MKKFILTFINKDGKKVCFPLAAENEAEAKAFGQSISTATQDFYGIPKFKLESCIAAAD